MNPYRETPAARLVDAALKDGDVTAAAVAGRAGISPNHLSMIRRGATTVPPLRCRALADALGIEAAVMTAACLASYADNRSWAAARMVLSS